MPRCSDARDRLLASASKLVRERGYSAVSVADICADAKLKKGSFYHFFPSKRDLVLATIDEFEAGHEARLRQVLAHRGTVAQQLARMFEMTAEGICTRAAADGCVRGCPMGNLALEIADRDEAIRAKLHGIFSRWVEGIETILRRGRDAEGLELADPSSVARSIVALVEGAILLAKTSNDPEMIRKIAPSALAIVAGAPKKSAEAAAAR